MEILGLTIPTWLAVAVPALYLLYRHMARDFDYFKQQGIKGPRPYPLVGTLMTMFSMGIIEHDKDLLRRYGKVVGTFTGSQPVLLLYDPKMAKEILSKQFNSFQNRQDMGFAEDPISKMMSLLRGDHWKHVRALMTPTFSGSRLRKMTDMMNKSAVNMRQAMADSLHKGDSFDIKTISGNFAMDAIASTAFGIELNSQKDPNSQFVAMAHKFFSRDLKSPRLMIMVFLPTFAKLLSKCGFAFFSRDTATFFSKVTDDAIKHRTEHPKTQANDFLQLMISARIDDPDVKAMSKDYATDATEIGSKTKLTHGEILAQGLLFFVAGYETTALTLSYLAYNLALNPDKQDTLLAEIDSVMAGKEEITYDMCKEMDYLRMCIDETLRIYPIFQRLDREAEEDITINGIRLRKGLSVHFSVYGMHHDPDVWEDPESFIPERFNPEARAARDPYTYLPFGTGPRSCIGMRLAILELKIAMATTLRDYRFVTCDETEIPVKTESVSISPVNGIKLKMEARK